MAIEPVLPAEGWNELGLDEFWSRLPEMDAVYAEAAGGGGRIAA